MVNSESLLGRFIYYSLLTQAHKEGLIKIRGTRTTTAYGKSRWTAHSFDPVLYTIRQIASLMTNSPISSAKRFIRPHSYRTDALGVLVPYTLSFKGSWRRGGPPKIEIELDPLIKGIIFDKQSITRLIIPAIAGSILELQNLYNPDQYEQYLSLFLNKVMEFVPLEDRAQVERIMAKVMFYA